MATSPVSSGATPPAPAPLSDVRQPAPGESALRMRAVYITGYGTNDVVQIGELTRPRPGPHDLLVEVRSASINPIDYKLRSGAMRPIRKYRFPLVLGFDVSGIVVDKGAEATRFQIGDEVFARISYPGALAEYVVDDENVWASKPSNISHADAASLPLVTLTAWQVLVDTANLRSGQTVLIHGGSGGVGTAAVQLAKAIGARVIATCSTANIDMVKGIGADEVIDYTREAFWERSPKVDVVLDTIGGDTLARSFSVIKPGGIVVSLAATPDADGMRKAGGGPLIAAIGQIANTGNFFRAWRTKSRYAYVWMHPSGDELQRIAELVERGHLRPMVSRHYTLEQVREALKALESGHTRGKIVIDVRPPLATPDLAAAARGFVPAALRPVETATGSPLLRPSPAALPRVASDEPAPATAAAAPAPASAAGPTAPAPVAAPAAPAEREREERGEEIKRTTAGATAELAAPTTHMEGEQPVSRADQPTAEQQSAEPAVEQTVEEAVGGETGATETTPATGKGKRGKGRKVSPPAGEAQPDLRV